MMDLCFTNILDTEKWLKLILTVANLLELNLGHYFFANSNQVGIFPIFFIFRDLFIFYIFVVIDLFF